MLRCQWSPVLYRSIDKPPVCIDINGIHQYGILYSPPLDGQDEYHSMKSRLTIPAQGRFVPWIVVILIAPDTMHVARSSTRAYE
jgi:hypothetical protein